MDVISAFRSDVIGFTVVVMTVIVVPVVDFIEADFAAVRISTSVVLLLVVTKALNREKMKVYMYFVTFHFNAAA